MRAIVFRAMGIACVMACLFAIAPDRCQGSALLWGSYQESYEWARGMSVWLYSFIYNGFVYADTPIYTDADLTVESFFGRFADAVDRCAAGKLDGRLCPWIIARILGWRFGFPGHWRSLSAVCTQKERTGSHLTIISL